MGISQKLLFSSLITAIIVAFAVTAVLAQEPPPPLEPLVEPGTLNLSTKLQKVGERAGFDAETNNLPELIGRVVQVFLSLLGIIFMGYMVYAGSLWITARGEEEKITKAKAIIRGSIIGLVVVFAAYAITFLVVSRLLDETSFTNK